jgi:LuxR family maltose regulon positive regulatory protein
LDSAIPLTKFRIPRLRRDTVPRAALLARLLQSVESNPLTIVRAPGGSGKTVLLSQLAAGIGGSREVLWVALDGDDNDANRFFAALCTTAAERVVIVLDDLHRLDDPEVFAILEGLLERLPEHVALLIGTRVEPPLSLARWKAHGEMVELGPPDLRFDEQDAQALAQRKLAGHADPELVRQALARSDGWAVGLSMLLQAAQGAGDHAAALERSGSHALLFEYLAEEVLAELPEELREFLLCCSILDELNPRLCAAVSGRDDAGLLLRELNRRRPPQPVRHPHRRAGAGAALPRPVPRVPEGGGAAALQRRGAR